MRKLLIAAALGVGLGLAGCGTVDAVLDCRAICSRYADCWDAKYDVDGCAARCRSHSSDDTEYRRRADQCNACITDRACPSASFNCAAECLSIIP